MIVPVGVKTPPEVASQIVALAREGKFSARWWWRDGCPACRRSLGLCGGGRRLGSHQIRRERNSGGDGEGPRCPVEYARNRRARLSERILDETERTLDLMSTCVLPRDRSLLAQALRHQSGAYADLTQADLNAAPTCLTWIRCFGLLLVQFQHSASQSRLTRGI